MSEEALETNISHCCRQWPLRHSEPAAKKINQRGRVRVGAWGGRSLMVYVLSVLNSGSVLDVHTDDEI